MDAGVSSNTGEDVARLAETDVDPVLGEEPVALDGDGLGGHRLTLA